MKTITLGLLTALCSISVLALDSGKPYSAPQTERENVFSFTEKPAVRFLGNDKYKITFAVKGYCDVTVGIIDKEGLVVRHLASGVLGKNAPEPFKKDALKQTIYWTGKNDLGVYVKKPGALNVRVMLGLKPVFDKRLGGSSPKNLPGSVLGIAASPEAVYVFSNGGMFGRIFIRKFDHDGNYKQSLLPPPSDLPESKLGGYSYVEYEPGKRAFHGSKLYDTVSNKGRWLAPLLASNMLSLQPVVVRDRLIFTNEGVVPNVPNSLLHWIHTDGSTKVAGIKGQLLVKGHVSHVNARIAASPDGKKLYFANIRYGSTSAGKQDRLQNTCVFVRSPDSKEPAKIFAGVANKPGADDKHLNNPMGIDCDSQGRVYVSDSRNYRIQVYSPDGKLLKSIKVDRPGLIAVHKRTGAIYVQHKASEKGRSMTRITKLTSFDNPTEEFHWNNFPGIMALDSWSKKPRLWMGKDLRHLIPNFEGNLGPSSLTVWEERGKKFVKVIDFEAEARKQAGSSWSGRWHGVGSNHTGKTECDPTREKLYAYGSKVYDLPTGKFDGAFKVEGRQDEISFDKRGFLHGHQNPIDIVPCIWRVDPGQVVKTDRKDKLGKRMGHASLAYPECPYDYGVICGSRHKKGWMGALAVKDQNGAKGFQDGFGVNMRGDIVVESNIYYVLKMEETGYEFAGQGLLARKKSGVYVDGGSGYYKFMNKIAAMKKRGEAVYSIRRRPGIPLFGATAWTFNQTGEMQKELAVIAGDLMAGVQIDEDAALYFVNGRAKKSKNDYFLKGSGGRLSDNGRTGKGYPFTGSLIKTKPDTYCHLLLRNSAVPLDPVPNRPADVAVLDWPGAKQSGDAWIKGAEWIYGGASPITSVGCSCPSSRLHVDWYKRTFVPEAYRHSIGILDTAGNLIMHVGRHANFDSAPGGPSGAKRGESDIGIAMARYISGTDNYLCFGDSGERIVVLKLDYHAEETVGIDMK